ncbi:phage tail protein [Escherichia coli]|nr:MULTISPECIES: phage tail protein [Enterobacteriaceae]EHD3373421.1 phage tail protein [Escherichia coli O124]EHD3421102.1 phage tail protein [Escherichia coli O167]EFJ9899017.1 phage tail protein [Escherichia coli]EFK6675796.1 phage tail protein [Escherichia coli]EHD3429036.1 phage tail protein [Escherichia coli O124]
MVTGFFQRVSDWITFWASVTATTIGVMTISEKIALAGLLLGSLSALHAWRHRRLMETAMQRRNELIASILAQSDAQPLHDSERQALNILRDNDTHDKAAR